MREVILCAEGDGSPPDELVEWWQCEELHVLPEAGGLRDQPAGLMHRLRTLGHVYRALKAWKDRGEGSSSETSEMRFARMYPDYWQVVQRVMEMERQWQEAQSN